MHLVVVLNAHAERVDENGGENAAREVIAVDESLDGRPAARDAARRLHFDRLVRLRRQLTMQSTLCICLPFA